MDCEDNFGGLEAIAHKPLLVPIMAIMGIIRESVLYNALMVSASTMRGN